MTPRQRWKAQYRQHRIIRRECYKAQMEALLFGTGVVLITDEPDYIKHIPIEEMEWPISTS